MTREDIIRMAREAGMRDYCDSWTVEDDPTRKQPKQIHTNDLASFAALVAAAAVEREREACAMLVENFAIDMDDEWVCGKAAEAIRARGENKMSGDHNMYQKRREAEAHAVPMTPEGVKSAQERWRGFNQGYKQAIKDCVALFMIQHEAAKGSHNYWHVAANLIEAEYGVHSDD